MNLKFRWKFNHYSKNPGCLQCAILKVLYGFKKTRANGAKYFSFKICEMRFLRSLKGTWNSPEQPVKLTQKLASKTTAPHSWYSYVVTIGVIIIVLLS